MRRAFADTPARAAAPVTLAQMSPANFALVMATGILATASHQQGHEWLAWSLAAVCALAWLAIGALTIARIVRHRDRVLDDLRSHQRAPGFLTAVAGTSVLGSVSLVVGLPRAWGIALAAVAAALWLALNYGILVVLTLRREKPALEDAISGSWLLLVVSTQSLAVIAALVAAGSPQPERLHLHFVALALWLSGGMLYVWVIALIFYRYLFLRFSPEDLTPTYWINMGAMAISTLAGALLVGNAPAAPLLLRILPVLEGGTLLYWAVGTWWVPMLLALVAWRYLHRRYPLRYDVGYWGAVFPLGMYSTATHQMSVALRLPFLAPVASGFFHVAALAWLCTMLGLGRQVLRIVRHRT